MEGQTVLLGHIASFEGDAELTEALVEVNVGSAPLPGQPPPDRRTDRGAAPASGDQPQGRGNHRGCRSDGLPRSCPAQPRARGARGRLSSGCGCPEISRLQIIAASDLEIRYESRPGAAWNSGELEDFVGKRATRHFPSGAVLTLTGVEVPPLIERGTPVVIVSEVGGIKVSAPGVARAAGGLGEIIPVENTISKQVVYGEIMDAETVRVMVGGQ